MTKEDLKQISRTIKEAKRWGLELDRLKCRSMIKGQEISDMPFSGEISDKVGNMATDIADCEDVIKGLIARAQMERRRILEYIEEIENSDIRQIVYYKCVSNCNWFDIARLMGEGYSADGVKKAYYRFLEKQNII